LFSQVFCHSNKKLTNTKPSWMAECLSHGTESATTRVSPGTLFCLLHAPTCLSAFHHDWEQQDS
jgi:hypothetical protein